jgi:putative membrane protein
VSDHAEESMPRLDRSTTLAYDRTRLAYQRTMLAWVRTGTSLITFGFAIYNFHRIATEGRQSGQLVGPHQFATIMVCIGLVALLLATFEYRQNIRALSDQYPDIPRSPLPTAVALLISALGILALVIMALRQ